MNSFLYFLPISALIALVASGTRNESIEEILKGALRLFVYLVIGTIFFSAVLQGSLMVPVLFYGLLALTLGVLGYYTFKEALQWLVGGGKKKEEGK